MTAPAHSLGTSGLLPVEDGDADDSKGEVQLKHSEEHVIRSPRNT
jgi:hypothetical protein